nr:MAG TPA: hypothetical protein [Caudoviricetes sp.]
MIFSTRIKIIRMPLKKRKILPLLEGKKYLKK